MGFSINRRSFIAAAAGFAALTMTMDTGMRMEPDNEKFTPILDCAVDAYTQTVASNNTTAFIKSMDACAEKENIGKDKFYFVARGAAAMAYQTEAPKGGSEFKFIATFGEIAQTANIYQPAVYQQIQDENLQIQKPQTGFKLD